MLAYSEASAGISRAVSPALLPLFDFAHTPPAAPTATTSAAPMNIPTGFVLASRASSGAVRPPSHHVSAAPPPFSTLASHASVTDLALTRDDLHGDAPG